MTTAKRQERGNADPKPTDPKLTKVLGDHLRRSLLPGDPELAPDRVREAAEFVLRAARLRKPGESVVLLESTPGARVTRIALINDDKPFLVDSAAAAVAAHGLTIELLVHPIVSVRRSEDGELAGVAPANGSGAGRESMIYLETARIEARERQAVEKDLRTTLADVHAAVSDWPKLRQAMERDAQGLADEEGATLLEWLSQGMLTQLGHLSIDREGGRSQVLGVCRKSTKEVLSDRSCARAFEWFEAEGTDAPLIVKANHISRVHRRVPLDLFIVPVMAEGRVAKLSIHAGIWTSAALSTPPKDVPVLRRHLGAIVDRLDVVPQSHDGKALAHALTALPHDLVIGFSESDLCRVATTMMALVDRPRTRLAIVASPLERHLFAFVWLPRDLMSTATRKHVQTLLESASGARTLDWSLLVEGGSLAMLRFVLDVRESRGRLPDEAQLDRQLQELLRGWAEAVEAALRDSEEAPRAAALASRYADAFPLGYRSAYSAAEAAQDIGRLRQLSLGEPARALGRDARLYRSEADRPGELRLKIYQLDGAMPLSDAVPALENFGFRVLAEVPTELGGNDPATIHDFRLTLPAGEDPTPLLQRAEAIEQAICAVINGEAEDDAFNRLVSGTGLSAQEADWLRALYRYLRQTTIAFTLHTAVDALRRAPAATRALIDLFVARHDPEAAANRDQAGAEAAERLRQALTAVSAINDDRLLRLYWAAIGAVLRTNAFAPAGQEALAFKFDSSQIPGLPKPVPWREIFVYSRRVEGIHLRAGPVARGGIRWSDRRDDFRIEVLGLMKAQRVKNAVIVPTGAKGGFYPKRLPDPALDRAAWAQEGRESYQLFIRTLLSITDNIVGDAVVHPPQVVIHDGDDPYFVVAADKGTASFSDTANAIALEHDFWLGDAFASGGSKGYDHKAMGITARGAWLSVQRHFSEMGIDVQRDPVRVAGCGDMSGDVFGNGMLLSQSIRLVAAFDHRHVFLDPDPDPMASWTERKRLFELPTSSWADYAEALLSAGGGIYPRTQKRIPLSPQVREMLGVDQDELDPDSLINAILKAPVDLLWFGGIGTYVKASHETHGQVGDPANDGLRASGDEVRAKVIGEGANLGVTQAGRIEYALIGSDGSGGRINTDFIDNSAGVDCSDNEVNIKIALGDAQRSGKLSEPRRVALLQDMTEDVAALVLEDNRLQALALSIAERGGPQAVPAQTRLIDTLERMGELDRRTEGLADTATLIRRSLDGQGLTRPELAVLLSTAKLVLQDAVEDSPLAADDATIPLLLSDFPPAMQRKFQPQILAHRLRPQIVATVVANDMVNRMGLVHPFELAEEEGAPLDHVAEAFVTASELLQMKALWGAIDAAEMPEAARLLLFEQAAFALRSHMADLLRSAGGALAPARIIGELASGVGNLIDHVDDLLAAEARDHAGEIADRLIVAGAPEALAARVANLFAIDGAIGLAGLARDLGLDPLDLTRAFILLGDRLGLGWAQAEASQMNPSDPWERLLVSGLARDFQQMRFEFLRSHAPERRSKRGVLSTVESWTEAHASAVAQFRAILLRAQAAGPVEPAMLAHVASQARNLLRR